MLAIATLVVASFALVEPARKASTTLTERVDAASFICIGVVDEIIPVPRPQGVPEGSFRSFAPPSMTFARVRVERVIKGDAATRVVYHEAWSTWTCDATRDTVGERSLFLLGPGLVSNMTEPHRQLVECTLSADFILRNVYDGDGIIPIRGQPEREYIHCSGCPEAWAFTEQPYATQWKPALAFVETLARFAPERVTLLAQRQGAEHSFDLRVLPDGKRRLEFYQSASMPLVVTVDRMEPTKWSQLRSALEPVIGRDDFTVGDDKLWLARRMRLRGEHGTFSYFQPFTFDTSAVPDEHRPALIRALEAWTIVRAAMDCTSCTDDRDDDRQRMLELAKPSEK